MVDCFDAWGITIPPSPDATVDDTELAGWIEQFPSIPSSDRVNYFNCVRALWDDIHFAEGGDQIMLQLKGSQIVIQTLPFDYEGLTGYEGLEFPPS